MSLVQPWPGSGRHVQAPRALPRPGGLLRRQRRPHLLRPRAAGRGAAPLPSARSPSRPVSARGRPSRRGAESPLPARPPPGSHLPSRRLLARSASAPGTSALLRAPLPAELHGSGSPGPSGDGKSFRKEFRGAADASTSSAMATPRCPAAASPGAGQAPAGTGAGRPAGEGKAGGRMRGDGSFKRSAGAGAGGGVACGEGAEPETNVWNAGAGPMATWPDGRGHLPGSGARAPGGAGGKCCRLSPRSAPRHGAIGTETCSRGTSLHRALPVLNAPPAQPLHPKINTDPFYSTL